MINFLIPLRNHVMRCCVYEYIFSWKNRNKNFELFTPRGKNSKESTEIVYLRNKQPRVEKNLSDDFYTFLVEDEHITFT